MPQPEADSGVKLYKAFPLPIALLLYLPWLVPIIIVNVVLLIQLTTHRYDQITLLLAALTFLLDIVPIMIIGAMTVWTSLTLNQEGIKFSGITLTQNQRYLIPFRTSFREVTARWDEIHGADWEGPTNGIMLIKTKNGDFNFWVMFNARMNREIMQEIITRAPQAKHAR